jgi:hypothetical protein
LSPYQCMNSLFYKPNTLAFNTAVRSGVRLILSLQMGLLHQPYRKISRDYWCKISGREKSKYMWRNLLQYYCVCCKSHTDYPQNVYHTQTSTISSSSTQSRLPPHVHQHCDDTFIHKNVMS